MKWKIGYSREAEKFINKQDIREKVKNALKKFLQAMKGESVNLDLTKLSGDWKGYYRIRIGKIRIIFDISKESREIFVEKVDHRGDVYK
jgi:mRNA interferase RelE/StbE